MVKNIEKTWNIVRISLILFVVGLFIGMGIYTETRYKTVECEVISKESSKKNEGYRYKVFSTEYFVICFKEEPVDVKIGDSIKIYYLPSEIDEQGIRYVQMYNIVNK